MTAKIERLKDKDSNIIYPITSLNAVYNTTDQTAKQYIESIRTYYVLVTDDEGNITLAGVKADSVTDANGASF